MFLKSCLNGSRSKTDHVRCPLTAAELAADAAAVVAVGIQALHVHPRNDEGDETLEAVHIAAAVTAIRKTVSVPIGVSTGAWFLPEPADRLDAIERWTTLPDFASVNFHEPGATEVARLLLDRDIGVEAGLWNLGAARSLMQSDIWHGCVRVLFEPMESRSRTLWRTSTPWRKPPARYRAALLGSSTATTEPSGPCSMRRTVAGIRVASASRTHWSVRGATRPSTTPTWPPPPSPSSTHRRPEKTNGDPVAGPDRRDVASASARSSRHRPTATQRLRA